MAQLSKESFVVEFIFKVLISRNYAKRGVTLKYVGDDFDINRVTKYNTLKNLEKEGYLEVRGKRWYMGDRLQELLNKLIYSF